MFGRRDMMMPMTGTRPFIVMDARLAEAYVPYQVYTESYSPSEALHRGTMFPALYRPYTKGEQLGGEEYDAD